MRAGPPATSHRLPGGRVQPEHGGCSRISTHLQYRHNIYTSTDGISTYLRIQVGLGEPAVAVSLTTQEEAPSGPPRGVRVEAVSSTQLRVTWQVRAGVMLGVYPPLVSSPDNCVEGGSFRALIEWCNGQFNAINILVSYSQLAKCKPREILMECFQYRTSNISNIYFISQNSLGP